MAAWGYEFYLRVLKVSLTRSLRSLVRYFQRVEDKIRIPERPFNILYIHPGGERLRPEIPMRWHASGSPEIRPNFSGSHTFSLTATAKIFVSPCPRECYYKAKRKLSLISG